MPREFMNISKGVLLRGEYYGRGGARARLNGVRFLISFPSVPDAIRWAAENGAILHCEELPK